MDEWVMKIDAIDNTNDLRNVKDYIHYKLRMEVRKEISDNSIQIKEQELAALKSKRDKELQREWHPRMNRIEDSYEDRGSHLAINNYKDHLAVKEQLRKDGGDEDSAIDVADAVHKVRGRKGILPSVAAAEKIDGIKDKHREVKKK